MKESVYLKEARKKISSQVKIEICGSESDSEAERVTNKELKKKVL